MYKRLTTLMLALAALTANAQTVIEGTVLDAAGKSVDAYVTVAPKGTGNILGFAEADSIQGRVIVRFVVEKDGRLTNYEVLRSPDDRLSEEALRVLHQMPRWQPAKKNGHPVRSHFCVPIVFRLN